MAPESTSRILAQLLCPEDRTFDTMGAPEQPVQHPELALQPKNTPDFERLLLNMLEQNQTKENTIVS